MERGDHVSFCLEYTPLTAVLGSMTIGVASEHTPSWSWNDAMKKLARGLPLYEAIQVVSKDRNRNLPFLGMTTVFGFACTDALGV
jgi:hypothetical protein